MAFLLLLIGAVLIDVVIRDDANELGELLQADLPGFLPWFGAIVILGALGYARPLRGASNALLILVFLVLFLSDKGIYANLSSAIVKPPAALQTAQTSEGTAAAQEASIIAADAPGGGSDTTGATGSPVATAASAASAVGGIGSALSGIAGFFAGL